MPVDPDLAADDCGSWLVPADLPCPVAADAEAQAAAEVAIARASAVLWYLSGRVYGPACPVVVRAPLGVCEVPADRYRTAASIDARRRQARSIDLGGPVFDVSSVTLDGVAFVDYAIEDGHRLVRTDGLLWPVRSSVEVVITYRPGRQVDALGLAAAGVLSCEFIKAGSGDPSCRLPANTRSASRQGVTVDLSTIIESLDDGRTGIREVDRWLRAVNPHRLAEPSRVYSVDRPRPTVIG